MIRTWLWHVVAGAVSLLLWLVPAQAQQFPSRPVTLIVPSAAGGTTDVGLRALASATEKHLGPMQMATTGAPDGQTQQELARRADLEGSRHRHGVELAVRTGWTEGHDPKVVQVLHGAFKKGMEEPSYLAAIVKIDQEPFYLNTADYRAFVTRTMAEQKQLMEELGSKPE
jgi:tripartite-type tricarboxylate transporter receptor subunit TctC